MYIGFIDARSRQRRAHSAERELFFVLFDTPEWHTHQRHRRAQAMPQLEPTTILRDGIAYRGARVPYPTPPGYPGPAAGPD
jgi:hypothetical protein